MIEKAILCPYCGGRVPVETTVCPDCHEDLAALVYLEFAHHILYNRALADAKEGRLAVARRKIIAALERKDDFVEGYRLLAKLAVAQGDWDEARRGAARAVDLAPGDPDVVRLAGDVEAAALHAQASEPARRGRVKKDVGRGKTHVGGGATDADVGASGVFGALVSWLGGGKDES